MGETILVLEDDDDIRTVLSDVLREAGFRAVAADHNGHLPDVPDVGLVLTDLPSAPLGYSSGAARDWVASIRDRYLAPVVVMTAHGEAASDETLRSLSAAIVMKPFEIDQLIGCVRTQAVKSAGVR